VWGLVASRLACRVLKPLLRAHERRRAVRVIELQEHTDIDARTWARWLAGTDGLLFVGHRRRAPRTSLPGPFLKDPTGRTVPVGWLPDLGEGLQCFASNAARVVDRQDDVRGPLALLGQWDARYLHLAERMESNLRSNGRMPFPIFRWTSERIMRDDLVKALRLGLGLAIYFGHGRSKGWAGYHGLRAEHLTEEPGEPLGALLSITCLTASRWRVGLSFLEKVVLGGAAAGTVGAVSRVKHVDNMRWMLGLARALREGALCLGQALAQAAPDDDRAQAAYRIIGDPMAPMLGTIQGLSRAVRVRAPAPDESIGS